VPKIYRGTCFEGRTPLEAGVHFLGSSARLKTMRRPEPDNRLGLVSRTKKFRSTARVAYSQTLPATGTATGVGFFEPRERWMIQSASSSTLR
jgi:hypothetical protein